MNVSLTPELEKLVNDRVRSGMYSSASEVIREALRLLNDQEKLRRQKLEDLRKEIQIGIDQIERGEVVEFDARRIKSLLRKRLREQAGRKAR
jgi:antitoxin ParD1/3/4